MSKETHTADAEAELIRQMDRLESLGKKWLGSFDRAQSGNATIEIHAGGIGMWISATCCAVMFVVGMAMAIIGGMAYTSTQQRLDRMQDYLNAIYTQAPQLKPKDTKS